MGSTKIAALFCVAVVSGLMYVPVATFLATHITALAAAVAGAGTP